MPRAAAAVAGLAGDPTELLRGRLLDSAEALLSERALSTITTRALAKHAGVSEGVLYNHFEDKNAVLLAALVRRFAALVEGFDAAAAQSHDLESLARRLVELNTEIAPLFAKLLGDRALLERFIADIHAAELPFGGKQIRDRVVAWLEGDDAAADVLLASAGAIALAGHVAPVDVEARISAVVEVLQRGKEQQ